MICRHVSSSMPLEDVAVLDSSLNLLVLVFVSGAVSLGWKYSMKVIHTQISTVVYSQLLIIAK